VLSQESCTFPCNADRIEIYDSPCSIDNWAEDVDYDAAELQQTPYITNEEKLVAALSIQNRCYGRELDRVLYLVEQLGGSTITSSRSLAKLESEALYDGLRFEPQTIEVPQIQNMLPILVNSLYPVHAVMRKDIGAAVAEMITRPYIWPHLHLRFEELRNDKGKRIYSSFYTANAWRSVQHHLGESRDLIGLLIFSDSTQILRFNTRSLHPIYMCPAGLEFKNMSLSSMSLIGFMPAIPVTLRDTLNDAGKKQLASWSRLLLSAVYSHIIKGIHKFTDGGLVIRHKNLHVQRVHPFVITSISDHLEGNNIALLETLSCRYCTLEPDQFASSDSLEFTYRSTSDNSDYPFHPLLCEGIKPFRPFVTAHCIFHDVDEGLWDWVATNILLPMFSNSADQTIMTALQIWRQWRRTTSN
jgi:hypothetical protein